MMLQDTKSKVYNLLLAKILLLPINRIEFVTLFI